MKRHAGDSKSVAEDAKIIMLDIEGTTTSISFVKDELFPYVRREVKTYLQKTWEDEQTKQDVAALVKQIELDIIEGLEGTELVPEGTDRDEVIESLVKNIYAMMDADRKVTPLKALQGHMWKQAYAKGELKGHIYKDVIDALKEWQQKEKQIVIYSSGSVDAQKLLFGHSVYGDLLHYFSHHFDTNIGSKVEKDSYLNIIKELKCKPEDLLFVTDLPKEAWAANDAGVKVVLSVREGTAPLSDEDKGAFLTITSFAQLLQKNSGSESPLPPTKKPCPEKELDKELKEENK